MLPVIQHALRWFDAHGNTFDAVCLLQPTAPLRRAADIDRCVELLDSSGADSVISVRPVPLEYNPHWVFFQDSDGFLHMSTGERAPIARRQDLPPAFHRDGSVYVTRRSTLLDDESLYGARTIGYVTDASTAINIDDEDDWRTAEQRLEGRLR
jgi:CMP-N-acetylneuraminic acid synthetase